MTGSATPTTHGRRSDEGLVPPEPGYRLMDETGFIDHIGPAWLRVEGGTATLLLLIEARHVNPNGTAHGGLLMTLMDVTLGSSVDGSLRASGGAPLEGHPITMQLSCNLIGASKLGETLRVEATVDRTTRTMGFASGRVTSGEGADSRLLMTASALFKVPTPRKV